MRYFICKKDQHKKTENISKYLQIEDEKEIYSETKLRSFSKKVHQHRQELMNLLYDIKKQNKTIVGISSPAKGNTLLNFCKIGPELLNYVTERNPLKINKFTPGMHIPVNSDDELLKHTPDYALILAWNFSEEIIKNNLDYQKKGGKFIIPIPKPKII